jgi:hypothetical protein
LSHVLISHSRNYVSIQYNVNVHVSIKANDFSSNVTNLEYGLFFYYLFFMDDLALNDVTLILDADMDADVSIETHMK